MYRSRRVVECSVVNSGTRRPRIVWLESCLGINRNLGGWGSGDAFRTIELPATTCSQVHIACGFLVIQ